MTILCVVPRLDEHVCGWDVDRGSRSSRTTVRTLKQYLTERSVTAKTGAGVVPECQDLPRQIAGPRVREWPQRRVSEARPAISRRMACSWLAFSRFENTSNQDAVGRQPFLLELSRVQSQPFCTFFEVAVHQRHLNSFVSYILCTSQTVQRIYGRKTTATVELLRSTTGFDLMDKRRD